MPTTRDRAWCRGLALECFDSQTYPNLELCMNFDAGSIGSKRNKAIKFSRGEIICHWDDDDWSHPDRVLYQFGLLLNSEEALITGFHSMEFRDGEDVWKYKGVRGYALGTSLMYWREAWLERPFEPIDIGEDNAFIKDRKVVSVDAGPLMWARVHDFNTSNKREKLGQSNNNWERIR